MFSGLTQRDCKKKKSIPFPTPPLRDWLITLVVVDCGLGFGE